MGEAHADADADTSFSDIEELEGKETVTVDTLNTEISEVLETSDHLYFDYVIGDVSDFGVSNGNVHFDLDHEDASIHCVLFEYRREWVTDDLDDGRQIAVSGDLSYYEVRGQCSVLVDDIVEIGEGSYQAEYEQNRSTLAQDGLLDGDQKRPLPDYPQQIGLVTSIDSDAREDAVTGIHSRHPGVDIVIQHATVQGDDAMPAIMQAISELDRDPAVDVIVLTRGGGADTTLRVFNETALCRVVFNTDTPIVVGIGHERDYTLAEEVADKRVMTPTHAGEIVPDKEALTSEHASLCDSLDTAYQRHARQRLTATADELDDAFEDHARSVLTTAAANLDHGFETAASEQLTELEQQLDHALAVLEQEREHEEEKEEAVEEAVQEKKDDLKEAATEEVKTEYEQRQRRQRIVIAVLVVVLLLLGLYIFVY
jgi:exodeoxyribonuclease VII large subunit